MVLVPLRGSQKSEVRSQKSGREAIYRVCTEVLIGKALNILSLVGYFRRAVLAIFFFHTLNNPLCQNIDNQSHEHQYQCRIHQG